MRHRVLRRLWRVHLLEFCDGLILIILGVALMTGKVRGVASALTGNRIASLLFIAAGSLLVGGRVAWSESERGVMWAWLALLGLAVLAYAATNFL
jgi:hypothetical protein